MPQIPLARVIHREITSQLLRREDLSEGDPDEYQQWIVMSRQSLCHIRNGIPGQISAQTLHTTPAEK